MRPEDKPLAITALARAYDLSCPRYMHWIRDPGDKRMARLEDTAEGRALAEMGERHEDAVIERLTGDVGFTVPDYPQGDLSAGMDVTLGLLEQKIPFVAQAAFSVQLEAPSFPIHGLVDLLRLVDAASGPVYQVVEVKASRRIKSSQMLQALLYAIMLDQVFAPPEQDDPPPPVVVDRFFEEHVVPIEAFQPIVQEFLGATIPHWMSQGENSFARTGRCVGCPFDDSCSEDARERKHPSMIAGIGRGVVERLETLGAETWKKIESIRPVYLHAAALDQGYMHRLGRQAQALEHDSIVPAPERIILERISVDLCLEVAGDPTGEYPCRLGLLKRDNDLRRSAYRGVVIPNVAGIAKEKASWFAKLVIRQLERASREDKSCMLLYYGALTGERLLGLGDLLEEEFADLLEEMVHQSTDLRTLVRRSWHLPVERYDLREVLESCGLPVISDMEAPFVRLRDWDVASDGDKEIIEADLLANGEAECGMLLSLYDWLVAGMANDHGSDNK